MLEDDAFQQEVSSSEISLSKNRSNVGDPTDASRTSITRGKGTLA